VCVFEGVSFLVVWVTVPINYLVLFFSSVEFKVFFLQSLIAQTALCVSLRRKRNLKQNFIATAALLKFLALKWCMTSPFIYQHTPCYSQLISRSAHYEILVGGHDGDQKDVQYMFAEETEQSLLDEHTTSEESSSSD
jgi:hypothetical protein